MSNNIGTPWVKRRWGHGQNGSALLIVLILLSLMATLMVSNSVILRRLRVELQRLEQKQKRGMEPLPKPLPQQTPQP